MKKAQISTEYLIVMGFVTFVLIVILGIALSYSGAVQDSIKSTQQKEFAERIISSAEEVFYAGTPSKATINVYLPKNVKQIDIIEDNIVLTTETSTGTEKTAYKSNVPLTGNLQINHGLNRVEIIATTNSAEISNA